LGLYEGLKGCSEEYTVVYNRAKKPHYYWYLKCVGGDKWVESIYLGKSPGGCNTVKSVARAASEAVAAARLRGVVEELDRVLRDLVEKLTQLSIILTAKHGGLVLQMHFRFIRWYAWSAYSYTLTN